VSNIEEMQNVMQSSEVEIRSPSAELMHRIFSELKNGQTRRITSESRGYFAGPSSRRLSSTPNVPVRTDFAGEDVPHLRSTSRQNFGIYISLVDAAIKTPIDAELQMETPSDSSPNRGTFGRQTKATAPRFRGPNETAFVFDAKHRCADLFGRRRPPDERSDIASSELECGQTIAHAQTAVQLVAASLQLDPTEVNLQCDGTAEPETKAAKPGKRRSMWKRTKRFVRRLLCCA